MRLWQQDVALSWKVDADRCPLFWGTDVPLGSCNIHDFLWHKIIIILWNRAINEERRESTSFPGKTQDLDMEGLFWVYSQVRDTPRTCFLICKMKMISCVPWGLLVWFEDLLTYWYEKISTPDLLLLLLFLIMRGLYMTFSAFSLLSMTYY